MSLYSWSFHTLHFTLLVLWIVVTDAKKQKTIQWKNNKNKQRRLRKTEMTQQTFFFFPRLFTYFPLFMNSKMSCSEEWQIKRPDETYALLKVFHKGKITIKELYIDFSEFGIAVSYFYIHDIMAWEMKTVQCKEKVKFIPSMTTFNN